ncbi:MAG TPA: hypothetical protein VFA57_04980 [Pseudolabrys sp.]|nr:hypothetical protein [Pseudolabrys sp.]
MTLRILAFLLSAFALFAVSAAPALAWWQFVGYNPSGERKVYGRYATEKTCNTALKQVDAELAKKYPKLYPRVGSCEEYR